ncbi:MFS domain-containing protein [Fusarium falciforme]|uniref:MFS domain-containing protein n=1 Tax=Fusarium falciforme TaxID=195108 RepID=UPI002301848F|nr:MFS domain-containing protein [Fusarium falciforme]WAO90310.1 MFS domain-containing protein [Fusarium falciforme]
MAIDKSQGLTKHRSVQTVSEVNPDEVTPLLSGETDRYDELEENERAEPPTGTQTPKDEEQRSVFGILSVLLIGVFVSQADTSLVLATYGAIASEFNDLQNASWLLSSYMLAMCMGQPLYGKLSDIFGRKFMLQVSYGLFATGSLLCGFCQSMPQLIVARSIQGLGGAGMVCLVSIIITDLVPLRDVATYRSYVNVVQTVGRSSGGAVGGFLAQAVGWRWALSGQAPLTVLAMLLVALNLETPQKSQGSDDETKSSLASKLGRIDFTGALFMSVTILSFLLIVDVGGEKVPWTSILIFLLGGVGLMSGLLFVIAESQAAEPIFPLHLLSSRAILTPYVIITMQNASQVALMFFIPLYFQVTKNATTGEAGAYMVPSIVGNTAGGLLAGFLIKRYGRYKLPTVFAALSSAFCFTLLLIFWRGHTSVLQSLFVFPGGFATGIAHSTTFVALAAGVEEQDLAIASSGLYLSGSVGAVAGLCSASAAFQSALRSALRKALIGGGIGNAPEVIQKALSDITYVQSLTGKAHSLVVGAYVSSFQVSFLLCIGLASVCLLASLSLNEKRLL